jgi:hypothetical protein
MRVIGVQLSADDLAQAKPDGHRPVPRYVVTRLIAFAAEHRLPLT